MNYTNESAFPIIGETHLIHEQGMTLRDYFAAKAMQALLVSPLNTEGFEINVLAEAAGRIADGMMKARK
jgi:hypothetical protein